jgi:hypothetical protein
MQLFISTYGEVAESLRDEVAGHVEGCAARLGLALPPAMAVRFFDTIQRQRAEQEREAERLGIATDKGDPLPVGHSAWGEMPRISVCGERLEPLPPLLRQGMVHVAAAHAMLHGSADYYVFRIPADIVREGKETGVDSTLLQQYLYRVATAVKGHAAVRLLVRRGFIADQVALALHELQPTEDDTLAWQMAKRDGRARALVQLAQLRPLLSAQPLLVHAPALAQELHQLTSFLPEEPRGRLMRLSVEIAGRLSENTREDIQQAFSLAWEQIVRREVLN